MKWFSRSSIIDNLGGMAFLSIMHNLGGKAARSIMDDLGGIDL